MINSSSHSYVVDALQMKYSLQILDDILLEDGVVRYVTSDRTFKGYFIYDISINILGSIKFISNILKNNEVPMCQIAWNMDTPLLISTDHILIFLKMIL